jgi:hypothetical protein
MDIVYAFLGRLPHYIVPTIHQARCFFDGPITLLVDDMESPYLEQLKPYNVTIVHAYDYVHLEFIQCVQENASKFCIAHKLGDRKLLFIRSFERFFLLQNWMTKHNKTDVLFLELDMLIYFKPSELLPILSKRELTFTHTQDNHKCSAFFYVKRVSALSDLNSYFLSYIRNPEHQSNISEMQAIWKWLEVPGVRERVWMLPGLWKDTQYHTDVWENFEAFQYSLFDSLGIAILIDGPDSTHREEWERRGRVWWGVDVRYNEYSYTWKTIDGKRIVYLQDTNHNEYKVQALHVHNKHIEAFLSKPLESK